MRYLLWWLFHFTNIPPLGETPSFWDAIGGWIVPLMLRSWQNVSKCIKMSQKSPVIVIEFFYGIVHPVKYPVDLRRTFLVSIGVTFPLIRPWPGRESWGSSMTTGWCKAEFPAQWLSESSYYPIWLVVSTPLKNISHLGWLFPIYGKIKHVPNHQPDMIGFVNKSLSPGIFQYRWVFHMMITHFIPSPILLNTRFQWSQICGFIPSYVNRGFWGMFRVRHQKRLDEPHRLLVPTPGHSQQIPQKPKSYFLRSYCRIEWGLV